MRSKLFVFVSLLILASFVLSACQPAAATPEKVVETVVIEKEGETIVSGSYRAISRDLNIGDAVTVKKPGDKSDDKPETDGN